MHIARCKKKNSTIRYTQQKRHPLMPFENNGTLQKWHMTNTASNIDKYDDTHKRCFTITAHLVKKCPKVISQGLS